MPCTTLYGDPTWLPSAAFNTVPVTACGCNSGHIIQVASFSKLSVWQTHTMLAVAIICSGIPSSLKILNQSHTRKLIGKYREEDI